MPQIHVWAVRISKGWIDLRAGAVPPKRHVSYLTNPPGEEDTWIPRLQQVCFLGGRVLATLSTKKYTKMVAHSKWPSKFTGGMAKFSEVAGAEVLDARWRKRYGL